MPEIEPHARPPWFLAAFGLFLTAAVAGGCASSSGDLPEKGELTRPPAASNGFESSVESGDVTVEARFYLKHESAFGDDLIDEEGVVPIAVRVVVPGDANAPKVKFRDQGRFRLYLEDGTVLKQANEVAEDDRKLNDRVAALAIRPGLIRSREGVEGFVYFKLPGEIEFDQTDDTRIVRRSRTGDCALDLANSLLAFDLERDGAVVPILVGVGRDHSFRRNTP